MTVKSRPHIGERATEGESYQTILQSDDNLDEFEIAYQRIQHKAVPAPDERKEERVWGRAGFAVIEPEAAGTGRLVPLFSEKDYSIVQRALLRLPVIEREVIVMRFYRHYDLISIAERLGMQLSAVEAYLDRAYETLKVNCLGHPGFSRSPFRKSTPLPLAA
jgi:DNA-directed RNA polymerase specialized sigma24 family protein